MGVRREGRELALQMLYALDVNPLTTREALLSFRENTRASVAVREFAEALVTGVMANREAIDRRIEEKAQNWSLARMSRVDLGVLRLAVFELSWRPDIPKNVTLNEAIEIVRKFGTEDSPAFVNGILDEIAASLPDEVRVDGEPIS